MKPVFLDIDTQRHVLSYLQDALDAGATTHAYLLAGGREDEAFSIAQCFAAGLIAGDDEDARDLVMRGTHPDLHVLRPAGAGGYLAEQIRELVGDAALAPIRAPRKVYILCSVQTLWGVPANALLKTLEEPPEDVVCILLATNEASVLETLRSRCETLALASSSAHVEADPELLEYLDGIARGCDNRTLLSYAKRVVEMSQAGSAELADEQAAALEESADYLSAGARKDIEQANKREITARERKALAGYIDAARTWLRDCLAVASGAADQRVLEQATRSSMNVGTSVSAASLVAALQACSRASERISYNVTPQLAIEAMFLEIREALCQQ